MGSPEVSSVDSFGVGRGCWGGRFRWGVAGSWGGAKNPKIEPLWLDLWPNDNEDGVIIADKTLGREVVLSAFGGVVRVEQGLIGWLPAKY